MAILSDTTLMVESWADGDFSFTDVCAPIMVGTDLLSAALDPVGALIAAPLGELLNFCVHHISFIAEPLAKLEGSDELVQSQAEKWTEIANSYIEAGNAHAASSRDLPSWTGPGAEAYHALLKETNGVFEAVSRSAQGMGLGVQAAGVLVGVLRGFIWEMITQLLTAAIEAGIAALAAAIPTFGASLAAFAGWYTMKVSAVALKVVSFLEKLLAKAKAFAGKCQKIVALIEKAETYCAKITKQLEAAQRYAGRTVNPTATRIPKSMRDEQVPKGSLPGDTTASHTTTNPNVKPPQPARGPLEAGNEISVEDALKDATLDQERNVTPKAPDVWDYIAGSRRVDSVQ